MDIKTLCLGMLTSGEATGYDLKKHFESTFSHFYTAGYGSIYPALADLAEAGLVTCTELAEQGKPAKKIYRITKAGTAHFKQALERACPCHKLRSEFLAMMYFAQLMTPQQIDGLLGHRVEEIDQMLFTLGEIAHRQPDAALGPEFVRGFGETVLRAARQYITEQRQTIRRSLRQGEAAA